MKIVGTKFKNSSGHEWTVMSRIGPKLYRVVSSNGAVRHGTLESIRTAVAKHTRAALYGKYMQRL